MIAIVIVHYNEQVNTEELPITQSVRFLSGFKSQTNPEKKHAKDPS